MKLLNAFFFLSGSILLYFLPYFLLPYIYPSVFPLIPIYHPIDYFSNLLFFFLSLSVLDSSQFTSLSSLVVVFTHHEASCLDQISSYIDLHLMKLHLSIVPGKSNFQSPEGVSPVPAEDPTFHVNKEDSRPSITLQSDPSLKFSFDSVSVQSLFENVSKPLVDRYLFKAKDSLVLGLEPFASKGPSCIFDHASSSQSACGLLSETLNYIFQQTGPTSLDPRAWSTYVSHMAIVGGQPGKQGDVERNENAALTISLFEVVENSIRDLLPSVNAGSRPSSRGRSTLSVVTSPKDGKIKPYNISQYLIGSCEDASSLVSKALASSSLSSASDSHKFVFVNLLRRSEPKHDGRRAVSVARLTFADLNNFARDQSTVEVGRCLELVATKQFNNSLLRTNKLTRLIFNDYVRSRVPLSVVVCLDQFGDESAILKTLKYTNPVEYHHLQRKHHDAAYYRSAEAMEHGRTVASFASKRRKPNSVGSRSVSASKRSSFGGSKHKPVSRVVSWSSGVREEKMKMVASLKEGKARLEAEVARLERDISSLKSGKSELEEKTKEEMKQLSLQHEKEVSELKEQIANAGSVDESEELAELGKRVEEKEKEASSLKESISAKEEAISGLESRIRVLEGEIKAKDESIAKINEELALKDKNLEEMKRQIEDKAGGIERLNEELEKYKKEIDELKKELEAKSAYSDANQGLAEEKSKEIEQLKQEIGDKTQKIDDLEQQLEKSASKMSQMQENAAKASEQFENDQKEGQRAVEQLTGEKNAAEKQNSELLEKISGMEKEAEEAKKSYESRVLELTQSNTVITEALKNTKISEENYRAQINALEENFAVMKDKYTQFKNTNKKKEQEQAKKYKTLRNKFKVLETQYITYRKNIENEKKKQDEIYAKKKRELKKKMNGICQSGSARSPETERSMSMSPKRSESLFDDEDGEKHSPFVSRSGTPSQSVKSSPLKKNDKEYQVDDGSPKTQPLSLTAIPHLENLDTPSPNIGGEEGKADRIPLEAATVSDLNTMSQKSQEGALKRKAVSPSKRDKVKLRQVDLDDSGDITL